MAYSTTTNTSRQRYTLLPLAMLMIPLVTSQRLPAIDITEEAVATPGTEWDGTWVGNNGYTGSNGIVSFDVVGNRVIKLIYGAVYPSGQCNSFSTFLTLTPGSPIDSNGSFTFTVPPGPGTIGVTATGNVTTIGNGTGLYNYLANANTVPGQPACSGSGSHSFTVQRRMPAASNQSWDGTWVGNNGYTGSNGIVSLDVVGNRVVKLIYGAVYPSGQCNSFSTFLTLSPGYPIDSNGSFTFTIPSGPGAIGVTATANISTTGVGTGLYNYNAAANSVPGQPACSGSGWHAFTVSRVGGPPPPPTAVNELLLSQGRVVVTLTWRSQYSGLTGNGTPVKQLDQYGYFWFDTADNPEVFVKVLDFGGNSYLVFHSALSDLEYTVTFRVLRTGQAYSFTRSPGSVCGLADNTTVKK
ncbi:MAG: hypothetical protein IT186_17900 [Acidobacteria bacterium]|nr:hypothetical protein [Acidobacteriota bacterium]